MSSAARSAEGSSVVRFERRVITEAEAVERSLEDFDDDSQEWRRLLSEVLGTFLLVQAVATPNNSMPPVAVIGDRRAAADEQQHQGAQELGPESTGDGCFHVSAAITSSSGRPAA
jgi:hypothetical protein